MNTITLISLSSNDKELLILILEITFEFSFSFSFSFGIIFFFFLKSSVKYILKIFCLSIVIWYIFSNKDKISLPKYFLNCLTANNIFSLKTEVSLKIDSKASFESSIPRLVLILFVIHLNFYLNTFHLYSYYFQ